MQMAQNRRRFLATLSAAGAAGLIGASHSFGQEAPPETTTIRLAKNRTASALRLNMSPRTCCAWKALPMFAMWRRMPASANRRALARGEIDFTLHFSRRRWSSRSMPANAITIIAGVHVGCFELFGDRRHPQHRETSRARRWAIPESGYIPARCSCRPWPPMSGLIPAKDIHWVTSPSIPPMELFADGKIDAFLGFPPEPQELRARNIGHVIVNSAIDRPWSQYFCCMLAGNRDFVRKNPVATKRVLRAILKATDFCVSDPARAAQRMVDGGFTARYDYALQTLKKSRTTSGGSTTPRTRSGSTRCGCARPA